MGKKNILPVIVFVEEIRAGRVSVVRNCRSIILH